MIQRLGEQDLRLDVRCQQPHVHELCHPRPSESQASPVPGTGDAWQTFDLPVGLSPGSHRLVLRGQEEGWDSVQLDHIEILPR